MADQVPAPLECQLQALATNPDRARNQSPVVPLLRRNLPPAMLARDEPLTQQMVGPFTQRHLETWCSPTRGRRSGGPPVARVTLSAKFLWGSIGYTLPAVKSGPRLRIRPPYGAKLIGDGGPHN